MSRRRKGTGQRPPLDPAVAGLICALARAAARRDHLEMATDRRLNRAKEPDPTEVSE